MISEVTCVNIGCSFLFYPIPQTCFSSSSYKMTRRSADQENRKRYFTKKGDEINKKILDSGRYNKKFFKIYRKQKKIQI
jgi:hypothetical protein